MSEKDHNDFFAAYGMDINNPKVDYSFTDAHIPSDIRIPVRIRFFDTSDANFVLNSWLKSYREAPAVSPVPPQYYFEGQQRLIAGLAETAQILIACDRDDPGQIFGWICYEQGLEGSIILHFLYVKHRYRGFGVAKLLIGEAGWLPGAHMWATHLTRSGHSLMQKLHAHFNPYLLTFRDFKGAFAPQTGATAPTGDLL